MFVFDCYPLVLKTAQERGERRAAGKEEQGRKNENSLAQKKEGNVD
jgi:hypothetical protein